MIPKDVENRLLLYFKQIEAMQVELSGQPQTEPFSYIHEKSEKIHGYMSLLTNIYSDALTWKGSISRSVRSQQAVRDIAFNRALLNDESTNKKRAVAYRKAAAELACAEEDARLSDLLDQLESVMNLIRLVKRKMETFEVMAVDLRAHLKIIDLERGMAEGYRRGVGSGVGPISGLRVEEVGIDAGEGGVGYAQTPTSEDLSLPDFSHSSAEVDEGPPAVGVEERVSSLLEGLSPAESSGEILENGDPAEVLMQGYVVTETQDLEELLQGVQLASVGKKEEGNVVSEGEKVESKLKLMGDVEDYSDLLNSI